MKDYSEFIKREAGFIIGINPVVEKGIVEVTTSKTKKGKPHVYRLKKGNIDKFYRRLENQYQLLIENKDEIFNQENKNIMSIFKLVRYVGIGILVIAFFISMIIIVTGNMGLFLPEIIGLMVCYGTYRVPNEIMKFKKQKFNEMIDTYKFYIEHRSEIESLAKVDINVTNAVDSRTQIELDESKKLVDTGLSAELFSIQFMDKVSLKQLKEIIERFEISRSLGEKQYFYIEDNNEEEMVEEEKGFSRKKIKK